MRAIIIEESRFAEVTELMRSAGKLAADHQMLRYDLKASGLTEDQINAMGEAVVRAMMLPFIRWAQDNGATCVRS